jgi:leukotriene-A4 hydrolase
LDTRDVHVDQVVELTTNTPLQFSLGQSSQCFGTSLTINVSNIQLGDKFQLKIVYRTSPNATALQWLEPNCTLGKKHGYLFSQCQAIHARSIVPCQDTPLVKATYDATVRVRQPLTVLMGAIHTETRQVDDLNEFKFEQNMPIPSYLIALASGALVSRELGPISRVWTEEEMIDRAAYEFEGVDQMIKDAESLMGPYVWGRYDLLVLPPTFPYGGMENPTLTFVTPTLISGDRSLVTVIQHEIAHSWTGNLVTNATWEHFWLNEGYTQFVERKLIGMYLKNDLCREFECIDGWRHLTEAVCEQFGCDNQLTKMVPCLNETDPDDAFSSIPYEKGSAFLYYLEGLLGGVEVFNEYLKAYIERFKGKSLNTDEWKAFLYEYFHDKVNFHS